MRTLVSAAALSLLLLSGCGDSPSNPAPSDPAPQVTQDVTPTSAEPPTDTDAATDSASDAARRTASAATATGDSAASPTGAVAAPSPAGGGATGTASAPPASGSCTADALSQGILGFTGGVTVHFCEDGWAFAAYPHAPGAPEFIAERVDGRWFHAVAIGDPVCSDDLTARGAPVSIAKLLPPCDGGSTPTTAPPTDGPTAAPSQPPAQHCVINTNLYGDTHAELIDVECAAARAEWELAEANAVPSWTIPWVTPTGWECYVTPYDPTSRAAGSCYGPSGSAYFTLYLP